MNRIQREIQGRQRFLLTGPPACAKTARIKQAASALGMRMFYGIGGRTADLMDRLDAAGVVMPDRVNKVAEVYPLRALKEIMECQVPAVWFLDELGRAPMDVQGALCSAMDALQECGSPVLVCAATNRPQDKAGVTSLSEQLRSRFDAAYSIPVPTMEGTEQKMAADKPDGSVLLGTWEEEVDGWVDWALDNAAPPEIVAYHQATGGKSLYRWAPCADAAVRKPDYRTWGSLIRRWNLGLRTLDDCAATIGKPDAAPFLAFARLGEYLPSPDQVWMDPASAPLPENPSAQWLVAATLSQAMTPALAPQFVAYVSRLPRLMTAFSAISAYNRLTKTGHGKQLSGCREWVKWWNANRTLFTKE